MGTCTGKHEASSKFDKKIWIIIEMTPLPPNFLSDF